MSRATSKLDRSLAIATQVCDRIGASLDRHLGSGAHKDAFRISIGGESFALKVAEATSLMSGRLEREISALQSCHHPAIAHLHSISMEQLEGVHYCVFVEEFLAGGTLLDRMARSLPHAYVKNVGLSLAGAIAHMEERNLVHRDIKPANILFRHEGEPVLTDFGIVRVVTEPSLTHDFIRQGPGTPLYAAPEQLNNDKALIDWRTDQFGLALVLSECLLHRPAFSTVGQSAQEAVLAVASRAALPDVSREELEQAGFGALVTALSPWPIARFRRPDDFIEALAGV